MDGIHVGFVSSNISAVILSAKWVEQTKELLEGTQFFLFILDNLLLVSI